MDTEDIAGWRLTLRKAKQCDAIPGQISLFEYMKPKPLNIKGLCDDAYCPECGYGFWYPGETDLPRCPECGTFVDWTQWHKMNDEEEENV